MQAPTPEIIDKMRKAAQEEEEEANNNMAATVNPYKTMGIFTMNMASTLGGTAAGATMLL